MSLVIKKRFFLSHSFFVSCIVLVVLNFAFTSSIAAQANQRPPLVSKSAYHKQQKATKQVVKKKKKKTALKKKAFISPFALNPKQNIFMKISSPAFSNNGSIPAKYTCDGENSSPPLDFFDVPQEAKSLVLLMDDPDVPKSIRSDGMWDHWVVWNIPPSSKSIGGGESPQGVVGRNTSGSMGYGGPCPPDREHRYFFKLYALDVMLDLAGGSSKTDVEKAMQGHILVRAELMGTYYRQ